MRKILWVIFVIVGISSAATVLEDNFHDAVTVGWTEDTDGGNSGTVTFGYGEPADTMLRLNCTDGRYDNLIYADPAPSNQIVYYEWYDSIASTNLADGNSFALIRTGPASNDVQIRTNLYNYGGVYYVRTMYRNNASAYDTSDTNGASINLGQKYRFRVLCDATNDIGAFYIDGTEIYNEELSLGKAFSFIQVGCIAPYNTHDDEYDRYVGHLLITDDGFIDPVEECDPMTVDSIRGIDSVAFGETAFVHLTGAKSYGTAAFLGFSVDTSFYDPDSCGVIMSKSGDGYLVITDSCGSQDSILLNVSRNEYAIDRSPYPINNEYAGTTDDHYLLGGSKMVRNDHTVISLVPQGEVEVTFRSFADGDSGTWIPIDTNSHSGCIVIDSSNRVHHFYRDSEGKRRLMWLNYPIDTTAMPEAVKIDSLESTSGYAFYDTYLSESATVNSKNEIYVTMTGLTDDSCFIWKYDGSWGSRLPVPDVVDGYQPDLKCGVDDTLFLVVSRSNEAVASKYHFIGKSYDGSSWSVNEYGPGQVNLVILPSRDDSIHLFAQTSTGLQHRLSTDNAETWGSWSLIQSTSGYADPSVALDSDWKIYVNMRNDPADDDVYYNYFMLSEDGGENFAFIDSLTTGEDEVGAKTGIRYQMWYNGGGPIERIWKQDIGAVNQIYYDRYDGAELADAPIDSFTLTITSATNGSVILDPVSGKVASGETVTATATANSGFQFDGWTGDTTTSESEITWSSMDEGKTIAAVFSEIVDPDSFTVTLSLAGTGTGDTALSPLVAGNKYQTGTEITLTSTPDPFNKFVASDTVTSSEYVFTIVTDSTLNVTFEAYPTYTWDTVTVCSGGLCGTIAVSPTDLTPDSTVVCSVFVASLESGYQCDSIVSIGSVSGRSSTTADTAFHTADENFIDSVFISEIPVDPTYDNLVIGNSISALISETRMNDRGVTGTLYNGGVGGYKTHEVDSILDGLLLSVNPTVVYAQCGSNDAGIGATKISIDSTIALFDTMLQKITTSGATMRVAELPPSQYLTPAETMFRNSRIREWCIDNSIPLARTYNLVLDTASERYMLPSFTDDGVHPNTATGRDTLAYAHATGSVPTDTFMIAENLYHTVCLGRGRKLITITGTGIEYRASNTWFNSKNTDISFTEYTGQIMTYDMFFQAKATSGDIVINNNRTGTLTSIVLTEDTIGWYHRGKSNYLVASLPDRSFGSNNLIGLNLATSVVSVLRFSLINVLDWGSYVNYNSKIGVYLYNTESTNRTIYISDLNKRWGFTDTASGSSRTSETTGAATWNNSYSYGDVGGQDTTWGNGAFDTAYDANGKVDSVLSTIGEGNGTLKVFSVNPVIESMYEDTTNFGFVFYSNQSATLQFAGDDDNPSSDGVRPYLLLQASEDSLYTVSITQPTNGSITYSPDTLLESGESIILTAVADEGYIFTGWGSDTTGTTNPFTWVSIAENKSLTAVFALLPSIDSVRNWRTLTPLHGKYTLVADTMTLYGSDIGDSSATSALSLNSTGTVPVTSILRWDGTNDSIAFIVPSTVRGGYKPRATNGENSLVSAIKDTTDIQVLTPGSD